ncbi:hypothetical protein ACF09L_31120 [Streptomyces sp. NPDC014779]|uniref:hypothetical protein n=1 Tax=unclassified Streptomyces TaxID=2593676 RepID=UPI0036F542D7
MTSLRTSLRRLRGARRSSDRTDVQFCDRCVEVVDRGSRAAALRRGHEAALSLLTVHL